MDICVPKMPYIASVNHFQGSFFVKDHAYGRGIPSAPVSA
jgi:hypothetical protein